MKFKRVLFALLSASFLFTATPITTHAATQITEQNVSVTSSEITFVFQFSIMQDYDITITDSVGGIYNYSYTTSQVSIPISEPVSGVYSIKVESSTKPDFDMSVSVIDSGKTASTIGGNTSITENVTDLNLYFMDGSLIATWNYSGNVNVTVSDPAKFNQITSGVKIAANEYRLEIPEGLSQVQFYIVPSTAAKQPGAGLTYTREVPREIEATVNFIDKDVVSGTGIKVPISVSSEEPLRVKIYNGNFSTEKNLPTDESIKCVLDDTVGAGDYEISIPLVSTNNNITVCFIDGKGNVKTYAHSYFRDMQAPTIDMSKLSIDNTGSYKNYSTYNDSIEISGSVSDEIATGMLGEIGKLTIDGYDVPVDQNGRFTFTQKLHLGVNDIDIVATDVSGNETAVTIQVSMLEVVKKPWYFYAIIIGVIVLAFVGIGLLSFYFVVPKLIERSNEIKRLAKENKELSDDGENDSRHSLFLDKLRYLVYHKIMKKPIPEEKPKSVPKAGNKPEAKKQFTIKKSQPITEGYEDPLVKHRDEERGKK